MPEQKAVSTPEAIKNNPHEYLIFLSEIEIPFLIQKITALERKLEYLTQKIDSNKH